MEKLINALFVGGSRLFRIPLKAFEWLLLTLLVISLIENGGSDGDLEPASRVVLFIGFVITILSFVLQWRYEAKLEAAEARRKAKQQEPAQPPFGTLPAFPPPVDYPLEPFPDYSSREAEKGGQKV
jgi:hypothetical protein